MKKFPYFLKFGFITLLLLTLNSVLMGQTYSIKVIQPNGGENWASGVSHLISWTDNLSGKVNILLSTDGGTTYSTTLASNVSGNTWNWNIPATGYSGSDYKIKVESAIDNKVEDVSNHTFSISDKGYIKVLQPNKKNIVWAQGTAHLISWNDNLKGNVNIMLSSDGGSHYSTLKSNVKGSTWSWKVPDNLNTGSSYKIKIVSAENPGVFDESNNDFAVKAVSQGSFIQVLQPNKNRIEWAQNTNHLISWNDNLKGKVNINLVKCQANGDIVKPWTLYTKENTNSGTNVGLPNVDIISLAIDAQGNYWVGTAVSLAKFDGKKWTSFTTPYLPDNIVTSLAEDNSGNIWAGTPQGLAKFNGTSWITFTTPVLPDNYVSSLAVDNSGNIWVGTYKGLAKFDGTNWTTYTYGSTNVPIFVNDITALAVDPSGNIWVGSTYGLAKFDGKKWTSFTTRFPNYVGNILSLASDDNGNIWVGINDGGLAKFDGKKWTSFTTPVLPGNTVYSIAVDDSGNIWVGTGSGLAIFDGEKWTTYTPGSTKIPLPTIDITSLAFDNAAGIKLIGSTYGFLASNCTTSTYVIKKGVSGSTYPWKITSQFPVYGYYKVKVSSADDPSVFDESNNLFAITKVPDVSFITVEQPNGGEQWTKGSSHLISWNDNLSGKVNVLLSTDDGNNYSLLKSNVKGSTWTWKIPSNTTISKKCKIKVESADDNTVNDESDNPFEITKVPDGSFITIKQPNGGEQWAVGTTHLISWNDNLSGKVNIYLENGTSSYLIKSGVEGSTYSWKIDGKDHASGSSATYSTGNNFKIKVVSADDNTMYGESDNPFEIIQKLTIDAFPNPATTQVTLKFNPKDNETYQISLYNRYNKNIFTRKVNAAYMKQLHISTFDLPNGFYFLRLTSPKGVIMKKIIVQH